MANDYPEQKVKLIGLLEAALGIGLITGPIIGSALYGWFGFKGCFFIFGSFEIVVGIAMRIMLPERRKKEQIQASTESDMRLIQLSEK